MTQSSETGHNSSTGQDQVDHLGIKGLLSPEIYNTIWKVAAPALNKEDPPTEFPHYTTPGTDKYEYVPPFKWTSGFFPGSIWALYERQLKKNGDAESAPVSPEQLLKAGRLWESGLVEQQFNTNTHDIGFLIMPAFQRDYELTGNEAALDIIIQAAKSLTTRYSSKTKAIRSWNEKVSKSYSYTDMNKHFLVIIDNMMNLELLYYAAEKSGNKKFYDIATTHAETTLKHHFRPDNSSYHLVVYDTQTGEVTGKMTHQGYADESTWSRGQAWALYGYAVTYKYTKDPKFLEASKKFTEMFLSKVAEDGTVFWDFDAERPTYWDVSAGMIACSGMLLQQQLDPTLNYLPYISKILSRAITGSSGNGDTILEHSTVNNNADAMPGMRIADTGLVYADYYFIETVNRLLDMGLIN
ncbi:Six-hairpin glycosidase-like protein [Umbelopsis sp. AD052]|nr:Six-hairpin glycosidase-like protein [Umbelopsis sp. AD052]